MPIEPAPNVINSPQGWRSYVIGAIGVCVSLGVSLGVVNQLDAQELIAHFNVGIDAIITLVGLIIVTLRQAIKSDGWKTNLTGTLTAVVAFVLGLLGVFGFQPSWLAGVQEKFVALIPTIGFVVAMFFRQAIAKAPSVRTPIVKPESK